MTSELEGAEESKRKWFIRMMDGKHDIGRTEFQGTLEQAKKYAHKWASQGDWLEPAVKVWVEIWDSNLYESDDAELIERWEQSSYNLNKFDPYREAEKIYRKEHAKDKCPMCGKVGPKIITPGLGRMDKYQSWRETNPAMYLGWCVCRKCRGIWGKVDEIYVQEVVKELKQKEASQQ